MHLVLIFSTIFIKINSFELDHNFDGHLTRSCLNLPAQIAKHKNSENVRIMIMTFELDILIFLLIQMLSNH